MLADLFWAQGALSLALFGLLALKLRTPLKGSSLRARVASFSVLLVLSGAIWGSYRLGGQHAELAAQRTLANIDHTLYQLRQDDLAPEPLAAAFLQKMQDFVQHAPKHSAVWERLGSIYENIGAYARAQALYAQALQQHPQHTGLQQLYAQAVSLGNAGRLDMQARAYVHAALHAVPDNQAMLNLAAVDAYQDGQLTQAWQYWQRLKQHVEPNSPARSAIDSALANIARKKPELSVTHAVVINIELQLPPELSAQAAAYPYVYVFAKHAKQGGPPLAVQQHRVDTWPLQLQLTDADAMLPGHQLQPGQDVIVAARLTQQADVLAEGPSLSTAEHRVHLDPALQTLTLRVLP